MTNTKVNTINFKLETMANDFAYSLSFFMDKVNSKEELTYNTYYVEDNNVYFL